jgi:Uma2 family endonuclease
MIPEIAELMDSTARPDYVEKMSAGLAIERVLRERFYDENDEGTKADFILEVLSGSKERVDCGKKFEDFECHGVAEYWIIDAEENRLAMKQIISD